MSGRATGRRLRMIGAAVLVATVFSGCAVGSTGPGAPGAEGSGGSGSGTGSESGSASAGAAGPGAPAPFALDADFPDPDVLQDGGTAYAFATNGQGRNIQLATSTTPDLSSWQVSTDDPLPELPPWAIPGKTWAPDVSRRADGTYVMYFTAANSVPSAQCIGVATSPTVTGPFTPQGSAPLVCPSADGGAIDPSTFVDDDGTTYLLFKNDGNCCGFDTWLQIAPLTADGLALAGEPVKLVKQDQAWEGLLVEAPVLVERDGSYVLFYSANDYGSDAYATGYATADALLGPYTKAPAPLLSTEGSGGRYLGPGGQDVVTLSDGSDAIVFHSWDELYISRGMNVLPLTWDGGTPKVDQAGVAAG